MVALHHLAHHDQLANSHHHVTGSSSNHASHSNHVNQYVHSYHVLIFRDQEHHLQTHLLMEDQTSQVNDFNHLVLATTVFHNLLDTVL